MGEWSSGKHQKENKLRYKKQTQNKSTKKLKEKKEGEGSEVKRNSLQDLCVHTESRFKPLIMLLLFFSLGSLHAV